MKIENSDLQDIGFMQATEEETKQPNRVTVKRKIIGHYQESNQMDSFGIAKPRKKLYLPD
jgi:hypothetical protein